MGRSHLTLQMSYRRRETSDASLADQLPKTKAPAAVSSIWFVRRSVGLDDGVHDDHWDGRVNQEARPQMRIAAAATSQGSTKQSRSNGLLRVKCHSPTVALPEV